MQRGFTLIYVLIAILILGLVAGGAYYLGQLNPQPLPPPSSTPPLPPLEKNLPIINKTPAQTADWKAYINNQYGFSMKYPSEWNFRETKGQVVLNNKGFSSTIVIFGEPNKKVLYGQEVNFTTGIVYLYITPSSNDYNFEKIQTNRYFNEIYGNQKFSFGLDLMVDGILAKQIVDNECFIWWCRTVIWEKSSNIYDARLNQEVDDELPKDVKSTKFKKLKIEIFETMLSTFKFTSP